MVLISEKGDTTRVDGKGRSKAGTECKRKSWTGNC